MSRTWKLAIVVGTRPEAIKLAPLILAAQARPDTFSTHVVRTSQHREMLDQMMGVFNIKADVDLDIMRPNQDLVHVMTTSLRGLYDDFRESRPDCVVVQGDTTTTLAGALASFYHKIPVAHVEAGLRTGHRYLPFPEEINRILSSHLAQWHFAPTARARDNLLAEGVEPEAIHVTGNTAIDALLMTLSSHNISIDKNSQREGRRQILLTTHRRENQGRPMEGICRAVLDLLDRYDDVEFLIPVHPSSTVRAVVFPMLSGHARVTLVDPLDYTDFVQAMHNSYLILTDSGGVQEEAPSLGKPVLVLRDSTERPEAVEAGTAKLVGAGRESIVTAVCELLDNPGSYAKMAQAINPFGDGQSSQRILDVLATSLRPGSA